LDENGKWENNMNSFLLIFLVTLCFIVSLQVIAFAQAKMTKKASSKVVYVHYRDLHPSQLRFASQNVEQKVKNILKKNNAILNKSTSQWSYKYYNGLSALSEKDSIPVVKASFGYALVDGHHNVLSNIAVGSEWIPIRVINDLCHLSLEAFWAEAELMGWAYLYDINGKKSFPPTLFSDLQDDPNRYFAAIAARKYKNEASRDSSGAEYPVWVKIGKDIPFVEFMISDAMWKSGLVYSYEMGDNPSIEFVESARQVLLESDIKGLRIIPTRTHYKDLNLSTL
jgi:hypothetical protein